MALSKRAPNFTRLPDEGISSVTQYAALIFTIAAAAVFLLRLYVFEGWLVNMKPYRARYAALDFRQRRSFIVHNVSIVLKVVMIGVGLYPFAAIVFGSSTPQDPVVALGTITLGDLIMVVVQIYQVMYIFELFYRVNISPVTSAHHVATILLGQVGVAYSINAKNTRDAVPEFVLCLLWGAFDVVGQLWPHVAMIWYRLQPDEHRFLARMFYTTAFIDAVSALVESAVVMWVYGTLWDRWSMPFRVLTPTIHIVFKAAQLWSAYKFVDFARTEMARLHAAKASENSRGSSLSGVKQEGGGGQV